MFNNQNQELYAEENERYRRKLSQLRQAIIEVEPSVLLDGRFEEMMSTPTAVIDIAHTLLLAQTSRTQVGS